MADTRPWNFTHNNEPVVTVQAPANVTREADVVRLGLAQIGQPDSQHPCRAWPVKETS